MPGASGPNDDGRFCTRALVAGANGSSGSVLPSSSALNGSGTVPEPESINTRAAEAVFGCGATRNVVMARCPSWGTLPTRPGRDSGPAAGLGSE